MTLEAYSQYHKENKADIMAHRQLRSVHLGEHLNMQFESELTIPTRFKRFYVLKNHLKSKVFWTKLKPTRRQCPMAATGKPLC